MFRKLKSSDKCKIQFTLDIHVFIKALDKYHRSSDGVNRGVDEDIAISPSQFPETVNHRGCWTLSSEDDFNVISQEVIFVTENAIRIIVGFSDEQKLFEFLKKLAFNKNIGFQSRLMYATYLLASGRSDLLDHYKQNLVNQEELKDKNWLIDHHVKQIYRIHDYVE